MIQLEHRNLPPYARAVLARWQRVIDDLPDYQDRVATAKETWGKRNTKKNRTFGVVRKTLVDMCPGDRRCSYCEDSCADEVEHFKPKDLYPDSAYVWRNYLYACGRCNGPKNTKFAIFSSTGHTYTEVTRKRSAPVTPPIAGEPVLLDPRSENPMDFLELELRSTFFFLPIAARGSRAYERAEYTIETLALNRRDELVAARQGAFKSYRALLREYINERDQGTHLRTLQRLVRSLQRQPHPFVWAEMKRSKDARRDLTTLFDAEPKALGW